MSLKLSHIESSKQLKTLLGIAHAHVYSFCQLERRTRSVKRKMMKTKRAISYLLILTMLLALLPLTVPVSAISVPGVYNKAGTAVATGGGITISPGTKLLVNGTSVTAGSTIRVYWDIPVGADAWLLSTTTGKPDGSYSFEITVPDTVNGSHYVWVQAANTMATASSAVLIVREGIEVDPTAEQVGASVAIIGIGLEPGLYNATFGSIRVITNGIVLGDGTISDTFIVPTVDPGSYDVIVEDSANNELSRTFTVISAPLTAVNVDDDDVRVGDVIMVWGPAGQVVSGATIKGYLDAIGPVYEVNDTTGQPDGSYSFEITVPNAVSGSHFIWVKDTYTQATMMSSVITVRAAIESCNSEGNKKDTFDLTEDIYINGSGFMSHAIYDMYVVDDVTWTDGMLIPPRVPGTASLLASSIDGSIPPILVWGSPLVIGKYDIVIDVNGNGIYDEGVDARDDMDITTEGFFVIPENVLGTIGVIAACLAAVILQSYITRAG
jgi:hypothetical protein